MEPKITICKDYWALNISTIEEMFKAKYIGDFCVRAKNGEWSDYPVSIFWQEHPEIEKGHTHYLGIYWMGGEWYITKGDSAFAEGLVGAVADNGEIIVSCYRHHFVESGDKTVFIDGGRDYLKTNASKLVKLKIEKDKLIVDEAITSKKADSTP